MNLESFGSPDEAPVADVRGSRSELVQLHGPHEWLSNVPFTARSPHRAATQLGRTVLRGVDLHETQ